MSDLPSSRSKDGFCQRHYHGLRRCIEEIMGPPVDDATYIEIDIRDIVKRACQKSEDRWKRQRGIHQDVLDVKHLNRSMFDAIISYISSTDDKCDLLVLGGLLLYEASECTEDLIQWENDSLSACGLSWLIALFLCQKILVTSAKKMASGELSWIQKMLNRAKKIDFKRLTPRLFFIFKSWCLSLVAIFSALHVVYSDLTHIVKALEIDLDISQLLSEGNKNEVVSAIEYTESYLEEISEKDKIKYITHLLQKLISGQVLYCRIRSLLHKIPMTLCACIGSIIPEIGLSLSTREVNHCLLDLWSFACRYSKNVSESALSHILLLLRQYHEPGIQKQTLILLQQIHKAGMLSTDQMQLYGHALIDCSMRTTTKSFHAQVLDSLLAFLEQGKCSGELINLVNSVLVPDIIRRIIEGASSIGSASHIRKDDPTTRLLRCPQVHVDLEVLVNLHQSLDGAVKTRIVEVLSDFFRHSEPFNWLLDLARSSNAEQSPEIFEAVVLALEISVRGHAISISRIVRQAWQKLDVFSPDDFDSTAGVIGSLNILNAFASFYECSEDDFSSLEKIIMQTKPSSVHRHILRLINACYHQPFNQSHIMGIVQRTLNSRLEDYMLVPVCQREVVRLCYSLPHPQYVVFEALASIQERSFHSFTLLTNFVRLLGIVADENVKHICKTHCVYSSMKQIDGKRDYLDAYRNLQNASRSIANQNARSLQEGFLSAYVPFVQRVLAQCFNNDFFDSDLMNQSSSAAVLLSSAALSSLGYFMTISLEITRENLILIQDVMAQSSCCKVLRVMTINIWREVLPVIPASCLERDKSVDLVYSIVSRSMEEESVHLAALKALGSLLLSNQIRHDRMHNIVSNIIHSNSRIREMVERLMYHYFDKNRKHASMLLYEIYFALQCSIRLMCTERLLEIVARLRINIERLQISLIEGMCSGAKQIEASELLSRLSPTRRTLAVLIAARQNGVLAQVDKNCSHHLTQYVKKIIGKGGRTEPVIQEMLQGMDSQLPSSDEVPLHQWSEETSTNVQQALKNLLNAQS